VSVRKAARRAVAAPSLVAERSFLACLKGQFFWFVMRKTLYGGTWP